MTVSYIWQSYSSSNLHWIYPLHSGKRLSNVNSPSAAEGLLRRKCNDIQDIQSNRMIELSLQGAYDSKRQQAYLKGLIPSKKKKTHIKKFFKKQKKSRKPVTFEQGYSSGPVILRFGNFAGIRDLRGARCPLHGIKHGVHPRPGERCACQQASFFPSPLTRVSREHSAVLDWTRASTRFCDNITDDFSTLYF